MLATENRTRSRIRRILAIALLVVGRQIRTIRVHGAILVALLALVVSGFSQTTVSTGGIQGTVTDPIGALVTGAIVSITNTATGQTAGWSVLWIMIWDTSIWRLECSNHSTIPSVQNCYLCSRYVLLPMSPGRTHGVRGCGGRI